MTTKYNGFWLCLVNVNGCIKARHTSPFNLKELCNYYTNSFKGPDFF